MSVTAIRAFIKPWTYSLHMIDTSIHIRMEKILQKWKLYNGDTDSLKNYVKALKRMPRKDYIKLLFVLKVRLSLR
ncbi:hypothetical protein C1646_717126 [Rhizophagus diaphanus]|nr:hypothetical protein C1646_717126 [Rhizophagus diaphanus] [Rhizophagus sp. MUCL 43196]